jgi:hypothetical protein
MLRNLIPHAEQVVTLPEVPKEAFSVAALEPFEKRFG